MPVNVTGLDVAPQPATRSTCWTTSPRPARSPRTAAARRAAEQRSAAAPTHVIARKPPARCDGQLGQTKTCQTLNLIMRADVRGSIEAIQKELGKLRASRSEDQGAAGHGRRHHRGRRHAGRMPRTRSSSASTSCPTKTPAPWPKSEGVRNPPLRHHLQADRRHQSDRSKASSSPKSAMVELGRALVQAGLHDQPRRHRRRLPGHSRHDRTRLPHPRQPRQPDHRRLRASTRSSARRTTPRKCRAAWNAASSWRTSTTSRRRRAGSVQDRGSCADRCSEEIRNPNVEIRNKFEIRMS